MFAIFKRYAASGAALMFTSGPSAGEVVGSYRGEPLYQQPGLCRIPRASARRWVRRGDARREGSQLRPTHDLARPGSCLANKAEWLHRVGTGG